MRALVALLFFFGQPFWETKPPDKWTEVDIGLLLSNSPWAQTVGPSPEVTIYLATAKPIEEAETELRARRKNFLPEPDPDYSIYLTDHGDESFVLAIPYTPATIAKLGAAKELKQLEEDSAMVIGKKTYKITGYFPPTPSDPVLRLVFPRRIQSSDKRVMFRLYLPGLDFPDREVEFQVKDLNYQGKLTY
jgi:hypothetical protein